MITFILIPFILAMILVVWFDTNAFIEYIELLKLEKINPVIEDYMGLRAIGDPSSFQEYLTSKYYDHFLGRLLTCPICVSVWLGGIAGLLASFVIWVSFGFIVAVCYAAALPYLTLIAYRLINKLK